MASSEFWQRLSASMASSHEGEAGAGAETGRGPRGASKFWMVMDGLTVLASRQVVIIPILRGDKAAVIARADAIADSLKKKRNTGLCGQQRTELARLEICRI